MPTDENLTPLSGKAALVTGGARRVGRAVALKLAEAGMDVAITFKSGAAEARQLVEQIERMGCGAAAIAVDLAEPDAAEHVYQQYTERFNNLYGLVNNASFFESGPIGRIDVGQYDRNMAVNARAPLMLIQRFTPMLSAHDAPGRVVNFIDIHVMGQPLRGYAAYNASKAALKEITMTSAMELAPKVTVNAIAPGVVAWADSYTDQMRREYMTRVPLARPGTPEDAAAAVLFLIRDASYCTGQIIKLDGGRLLT